MLPYLFFSSKWGTTPASASIDAHSHFIAAFGGLQYVNRKIVDPLMLVVGVRWLSRHNSSEMSPGEIERSSTVLVTL